MKLLILIVALFLFTETPAQHTHTTDLHLKGSVKRLEQTVTFLSDSAAIGRIDNHTIDFDQNGKCLQKSYLLSNGCAYKTDIFLYDEHGNEISYESEDAYTGKKMLRTYVYRYNDKYSILERKQFNKGVFQSMSRYEYDRDTNIIKETHYGQDSTISMWKIKTYLHKKVVHEKGYTGDGVVYQEYKREYNRKGLEISNTSMSYEEQVSKNEYQYDSSGRVTEISSYRKPLVNVKGMYERSITYYSYNDELNSVTTRTYANGTLVAQTYVRYDSNKNAVESKSEYLNLSGQWTTLYNMKYEIIYDNNGNWIEWKESSGNASVKIMSRKIIYY